MSIEPDDEHLPHMKRALELAKVAAQGGEVPVGAVIVRDGAIIAEAYNQKEQLKSALLHAEMLAIEQASQRLGQWRLSGCDLYVSLEPCLMCSGAIIASRISRVFFGTYDKKAGAFGSLYSIHTDERLNHSPKVISGILCEESKNLLQKFFREKRLQQRSTTPSPID